MTETVALSPAAQRAARTREALRQEAIRQFVAHGFEATTVPAIAAAVGVTERTFYRHFATKDEVLFIDVTTGLQWFRESVSARLAAGEDLAAAVLASISAPPTDPRLMIEIARLRRQLLSPARIERSFREAQGAMAGHVRAALLEHSPGDPLGAAVRAEVAAGAVFAALTVWTEEPGPLQRLVELTRDSLDRVAPVLGGDAATG